MTDAMVMWTTKLRKINRKMYGLDANFIFQQDTDPMESNPRQKTNAAAENWNINNSPECIRFIKVGFISKLDTCGFQIFIANERNERTIEYWQSYIE